MSCLSSLADTQATTSTEHEGSMDPQEREDRARREIYQRVVDDMAERGEVTQFSGGPDHEYSPGCCKHEYDRACRCFACSERRVFLRGIGRDVPATADWRTTAAGPGGRSSEHA